jgi:anti-anti-sigma factor
VTDEHDVPSRLSFDGAGSTLVVAGELDAHSAPGLRERLGASTDGAETVLDMSGITFMDSSGLRVLIDAHRQAADRERRLVVVEPSPSVRRVLEIAGVLDHLDVRDSAAPDRAADTS